jgi:hypothetical protein
MGSHLPFRLVVDVTALYNFAYMTFEQLIPLFQMLFHVDL